MNWNDHQYIYQLVHPWHWLGYGPNATNVAAVAALIAAIATVTAAIFAARAYFATLKQLKMARKQLLLAKKQFDTEVRRLEEERSANKRAAHALYERTKAEEDGTRPRFSISSGTTNVAEQSVDFTNNGSTPATDVTVRSLVTGKLFGQKDAVQSAHIIRAMVVTDELQDPGVLITFRSRFGSSWTTVVKSVAPTETVLAVTRIYEPPSEVD
jgi:hypothetical protein